MEKNAFPLYYASRTEHFQCIKCNNAPILQVREQNKFLVECCEPGKKKLVDIQNLKENYLVDSIEDDILRCKDHDKSFKDYCFICFRNFCESCEDCHHLKINIYNNNLDDKIDDLKKLFFKDNLEEKVEVEEISIKKNKKLDDSELLKSIISIIINDYKQEKNYHLYMSIKNLAEYFKNHQPDLAIDNSLPEFCITSPNELESSENVTKVVIYQYCFDLNKLNIKLPNLIELSLKNNNIFNVEILIICDFPNLEKLYLDNNKIDDNIYHYMKDMKFEKLKEFSLKQNYLTEYKIFEEISVFKNLKTFDISSNRFKNNDYFRDKTINLNNLEELILSNGVFDQNSINDIKSLQLEKLKSIDLSSNNLTSLKFIKDCKWENLTKLILNENDISDIQDLITKFKEISKPLTIIIENNLIKDENQINSLIDSNKKITIKYKLNSEIKNNETIINNSYETNIN